MLCGVLRMPSNLALSDELSTVQHFSFCQEAANELEKRADLINEQQSKIKQLENPKKTTNDLWTIIKEYEDGSLLIENISGNRRHIWQELHKEPTQHAGDCTIYASMCNNQPTDGICTCGFGWNQVRKLDCSKMYSNERISGESVTNIMSEDVDVEQIAKMDVAISKANNYFNNKYLPSKMIEIPLDNDGVIHCSSTPPVELFWTPTRHHPHENLNYIIVWGYDVRHLHHESNRSSPAYSIYCGPINKWIEEYSENPEKLEQLEKYILEVRPQTTKL